MMHDDDEVHRHSLQLQRCGPNVGGAALVQSIGKSAMRRSGVCRRHLLGGEGGAAVLLLFGSFCVFFPHQLGTNTALTLQ